MQPRSASWRSGSAFAPVLALLASFALGLSGGFVYAHEPAPPEVRAVLTREPAPPETLVRGTLSAIGPDFLEIATPEGVRRLSLPPGVGVEELIPLGGSVAPGSTVNVGGNRTESGFVITGVVVVVDGSAR